MNAIPINLSVDAFWLALVFFSLITSRAPKKTADRYDRVLYWIAGLVLLSFAAFRPFGVASDDYGAYAEYLPDLACPSIQCGKLIQGERDKAWYSIVGLLKSVYPKPEVVLWMSGMALAVKLWVIDRLCTNRTMALIIYIPFFYIIHDITALRVSFAIAVYLIGFYFLVRGRLHSGVIALALNGFFHQQAFVAILLVIGRWIPINSFLMQGLVLFPFFLLMTGVYVGDGSLQWLFSQAWGPKLLNIIFHGYELKKIHGDYYNVRTWPIVALPTLLVSAFLLRDLITRHISLYKYSFASLMIASIFLWLFAAVPEVQLRFWHFFLVPIVIVIGNMRMTWFRIICALALSGIYIAKYTLLHELLHDQRRIEWEEPIGGSISILTPAIAFNKHHGYNVKKGSVAKILAKANPGYRFSGWKGACEGSLLSCDVKVDVDIFLVASFEKILPD